MRNLLVLLTALALSGIASAAEWAKNTSYLAPDGSRVLRVEVVVRASLADTWTAFTTPEGWRTWAVPYSTLSAPKLAQGAEFESAFDPAAKPGADTNIRHRILAFIPDRMFAYHISQTPKGFPHPEEIRPVFSVVEFEPLSAKKTRVKLSMIGYGTGPNADSLYSFFAEDNARVLGKLAERFESGPIDWKKALTR